MVQWCWENFQCRGVLLIWMSRARAFCACSRCGWGCLDICSLVYHFSFFLPLSGRRGRRVLRWCWVNCQCWGVLLILIKVGQGPSALTVGAGGGCLDIFYLIFHFSLLSPSLLETARYRLKYCLKGPLSPKQPTNQPLWETAPYRLKYCLKGPLSPKQPTNQLTWISLD